MYLLTVLTYLHTQLAYNHLQIIKIPGDDVALNSSHSITVNIQSGNRYIGEGAVEATIVDDDCKWI